MSSASCSDACMGPALSVPGDRLGEIGSVVCPGKLIKLPSLSEVLAAGASTAAVIYRHFAALPPKTFRKALSARLAYCS